MNTTKKAALATKDRVLLILREVGNIITNFIVPITAIVIIVLEFIPGIPYGVLHMLKMFEDYMYNAFGTVEKIEEKIKQKAK